MNAFAERAAQVAETLREAADNRARALTSLVGYEIRSAEADAVVVLADLLVELARSRDVG